jgi:hypothetical protein
MTDKLRIDHKLRIDPERRGEFATGIYVRAELSDGVFDNVDIGELDRKSLLAWLRSRGGINIWAESVVFLMLGHEPLMTDERDKEAQDGA